MTRRPLESVNCLIGVGGSFNLSATLISIRPDFFRACVTPGGIRNSNMGVTLKTTRRSGRSFVDQAAQLGAQSFNLGEFLLDSLKERRLRFYSFFNQKTGRLGAITKYSSLHELLDFLLSRWGNLDGHHVIILGGNCALDSATDVAADRA